MILGAIDIGSNAARLLINEVTEDAKGIVTFSKKNLLRVPLRLGFDVFDKKKISPEKTTMLLETMYAFGHLIKAYNVTAVKACATSAMRDAENAAEILAMVKEKTGIDIEVISGQLEANLVFENHVAENMDAMHSYMYIDVGGGSTEISFFSKGVLVFKNSFNIGTIRLLKKQVPDTAWEEMKNSIKSITRDYNDVVAIGSGGNINKVFSLSKKKDDKPLHLDLLRNYYKELEAVSLPDRISKYGLREDRADVIVPALFIYINAMRWSGASEIFVPKIGLADGLIHHLWDELKQQKK